MFAFGDESIRESDQEGFYVLSAACFPVAVLDEAREVLRDLRGGRHTKVHWTEMDHKQRVDACHRLATLDGLHLVVIGAPVPPRRQERARALCLVRLALELAGAGVDELLLESRHWAQDRADIRTVAGARQSVLPRGTPFRVDHCPGDLEPLLGAADIVAGACRAAQLGRGEYRDLLVDLVYDIHLDTGLAPR